MVLATYRIIQRFFMPVFWGIIIAVAVEPLVGRMAQRLGGGRKMAAILFALVVIAALVIPSVMLVFSSIDTVQSLFLLWLGACTMLDRDSRGYLLRKKCLPR